MNLKERGITIGDLLIIIIIILTTTILVKTFNKEKKTSLYLSNNEHLSCMQILFSKNALNDLSV